MLSYLLTCKTQTQRLATELAQHCPEKKRFIIFLNGELGAGKTTFVRFFLDALGYNGLVKSPTYTLVETYTLPKHDIFHLDLYRLQTPTELFETGLHDEFDRSAIWLIEWPERAQNHLPQADIHCTFTLEKHHRQLELRSQTHTGQQLLRTISSAIVDT